MLDGKAYTLQKQGYARHCTFAVEAQTADSATLLQKSDAQSKAVFPFDYELRVVYQLSEKSLAVDYVVTNRSDRTMYFSIGAHEGYTCPDGIAEYDILFPQEETLNAWVLNGNLLAYKTVPVMQNSRVLPLKDDYFAADALVFKDVKSRSAILRKPHIRTGCSGFI